MKKIIIAAYNNRYLERILSLLDFAQIEVIAVGLAILSTDERDHYLTGNDELMIGFDNHDIPAYRYDVWENNIADYNFDYVFIALPQGISSVVKKNIIRTYPKLKYKISDLNRLFAPEICSLSTLWSYYENHACEAEFLLTGSSYAVHGNDMRVYEGSAVNLAGVSQDLYTDFELAKKFITSIRNHIKSVVIGVAPWSLSADVSQLDVNDVSFVYYPILRDMHHYPLQNKMMEQIFNENYKDYHKWSSQEYQQLLHEKDRFGYFQAEFMQLPLQSNYILKARVKAEADSIAFHPTTVDEYEHILCEYIEWVKGQGMQPVICMYPLTDLYYNWLDDRMLEEFADRFTAVIERTHCNVINLLQTDKVGYDDFFDTEHLNNRGAQKVSRMIKEYLDYHK